MKRWFDLQLFAGTEDEDSQAGDEQETSNGEPTDEPDNSGKTFSQDEVNRIITQRLERERKQWQQQLEEEKKKAKMDEVERLQAEKQEAEQKLQESLDAANRRAIAAEAKLQAQEMGIDPKAAVRLADLSAVTVDGDDIQGVKEALEAAIAEYEVLKPQAEKRGVGRGSNPGAGGQKTKNPWLPELRNLTEQGRLMRDDPALAERLKAEAGIKR